MEIPQLFLDLVDKGWAKCQNFSFQINLFRYWYLLRRIYNLWLLPCRKDERDDIIPEINQYADIGMEKILSTLWIYWIRVRSKLTIDIFSNLRVGRRPKHSIAWRHQIVKCVIHKLSLWTKILHFLYGPCKEFSVLYAGNNLC